MQNYFRMYLNTFLACPKKYLTLLGGLIYFIGLGTLSAGSVTTPYYLSYLQNRAGSKSARYPNTLYLGTVLFIVNSISATMFGLLKNKFGYSYKQMSFVGSLIWGQVFFKSMIRIKKL